MTLAFWIPNIMRSDRRHQFLPAGVVSIDFWGYGRLKDDGPEFEKL